MFDVQSGQSSQIAVHDAPIKAVKWIDAQGGILATGSWDKTIKVSWNGISRVPCRIYEAVSSIGIFGSKVRLPQPLYLNDATQWMWHIRSWLLVAQTEKSTSTI